MLRISMAKILWYFYFLKFKNFLILLQYTYSFSQFSFYKYLSIHFFLRKQEQTVQCDRSSRRDKTRQRNQVHSNPTALVTLCSDKYTRYACNYARASNFVCALLKRFDSLCHPIFQSFPPFKIKMNRVYATH